MANHCIRRIVAKQANVDTFAGICGVAGFKDGVFGQNLLNKPELVGTDHNGTLYIYDSGNQYIRVVNASTKIMRTMIHGSCKLDYMTSTPKNNPVPFQLELKPMICFTTWIKTSGAPENHLVTLPAKPEIIDSSFILTGYGDEEEEPVETTPAEPSGNTGEGSESSSEEQKPEGTEETPEGTSETTPEGPEGTETPDSSGASEQPEGTETAPDDTPDDSGGGGDDEEPEAQATEEEMQCYD
mmetsp:Transcript_24676/g.38386  ORF Transcript_24676/g.38386 Transcript_24676/m.38386 type:complete len:241 (+) Transcript_24676:734-1456(+)